MRTTKFYILGASGFLGSQCADYLAKHGHKVFTERIDITDFKALKKKIKETKPDVVIDFAGVRAYPNIDWCEDHKEETISVNVAGAVNAMLAAIENGAFPIQISSGCIYSGGPAKHFSEEDRPNFFGSFYSRMRIAMEMALKELPVLQARIRMPISSCPHPRNLINKLISYEKIISLPNSVTLLEDLWPALLKIAKLRPTGILNLTNDGYIQQEDIVKKYKEIVSPAHRYSVISIKELEGRLGLVKAQRANCVLSNQKALSMGIKMPAIDDKRLTKIMRDFKGNLGKTVNSI